MSHRPTNRVSEPLKNLSDFAKRCVEQLAAKKEKAKTLTDAENLLLEEQNYCKVIARCIGNLSEEDKWGCRDIVVDLVALAIDYKIVDKHREGYRKQRVANLRNLAKIEQYESILEPRPNFRVTRVSKYSDDTLVEANEEAHEFTYRLTEAILYFWGLVEQHCDDNDPTGRWGDPSGENSWPQGSLQFPIPILFRENIPTRCASRDFIFNPERSFYEEYERVIRQYIEESIADPANFKLTKFLPPLTPNFPRPRPDSDDPDID